MGKWDMTREIGYQKPKGDAVPVSAKVAPPKEVKKKKEKAADPGNENNVESGPHISLVDWLKTHSLIKMSALCQAAEIDPGNFHRQLNVKKEIPKEIQEKLIPILKAYGFKDSL